MKNKKIESISEEFWPIIDYNYEQIRFAEIKASVIISFYSLLLTVGYTLDILDEDNIYNPLCPSCRNYNDWKN